MSFFRHLSLLVAVAVAVAFTVAGPRSSHAESLFDMLVKPGAVVKAHEKAEKDCHSCHKPFSKAAQDELCLDCHKEIASDIEHGTRLHGKRKYSGGTACRFCHTDHKGRDADIVQLDPDTFDHGTTSYPLTGGHTSVQCGACHLSGKKYREASSVCADCHRSADPHMGQLGLACESCHTAKAWTDTKTFDHKMSRFPLTGAHEKVMCTACHAGERYLGTPTGCVDCHRKDDKHLGTLGPKCKTCHTTASWIEKAFDHDRDTKYPLLGKHAPVACEACHKEPIGKSKTPTACNDCHERDDVHKGRLGRECQSCHTESGWRLGALFDHAKTKLPLTGKHGDAKCSDCHKGKIYDKVDAACISCHAKKDDHEGRLGPKCEQCHDDVNWKVWHFDHTKQTKYPLTGAHVKTGCYQCHAEKGVKSATLPTDCMSCHKRQDVHRGAFGKACEKCHTTKAFTPAFIRR